MLHARNVAWKSSYICAHGQANITLRNDTLIANVYTTVNFTRNSVTKVGTLSAAGWAWSARGRHTLRWEVGVAGWAWSLRGKQI